MATRRELIKAVAARYSSAGHVAKKKILDEFVEVTKFHRKHAIRVLNKPEKQQQREPRQRERIYDEAVLSALTIVWEAADGICGKRLHKVVAGLVEAMERHSHLRLDGEVRERLLKMSPATMDRLLMGVREASKQGRRRSGVNNTALRKSIAVRTFGDWHDPAPGYFEMDMVARCGKSLAGSHLHSLVLTDIATGWTEAVAMIIREQTLVVESVESVRTKLPFTMLGLDVDNDGAFINETLVNYCRDQKLELTRCRAYKKNDQAWIEQKNGAVVPHLPAGSGIDVFRQNVKCLVRGAGGVFRFRAAFQSRHVRGWMRRAEMPRMDSVVALSLNQNVPVVRLLTEPVPCRNTDDARTWYVHHRVSDSVIEHALRTALQAVIPPPLQEIANRLQYRTVH